MIRPYKYLRSIFRARHAKKFGMHIFTFPDGERLYQLREDYFERLPNAKLEYIQENANYIAYLGISKHTLYAAIDKIADLTEQIKSVVSLKQDPAKLIESQKKVLGYIRDNTANYDKTQEHIIVSLFDMFFFFEDENIFAWSEEALEKKRHYLNEYPYFRNFFLRRLESYQTTFRVTYESAIRLAIQQTAIQEVIRDMTFTDTSETETA